MADLAFRTYQSTRHAWGAFQAVHGRYDGLTTGTVSHPHLQLLVPLAGRIQLTWGAEALTLGPERAVLIRPDTPHAATTLGGELEFVAINAPPSWLAELGEALGAPAAGRSGVVALPGVAWLAGRQLAEALDSQGVGFERLLRAGAEQLGVYACQALAEAVPAGPPDPISRAVDRVLRGHAEPLTVEGLAAEMAMSPRHFERRFKEVVGMPPRKFLIGVRLAAARDRLAGTDEPVEAIAYAVGFGNVSHFTRTFTQAMRQSPTAYRRSRRAGAGFGD
ncbi:MAG: helix-turn-helix domain-containing protein [Candidatus Sericytochromatia bacterium]